MHPEVTRTMGGYRLGRELGRGGMGAVFEGTHALLGRRAAVKLLLPAYGRDRAAVARFFAEARAASAARHPNIVEIFDVGFAGDGTAFITMERLDGETLAVHLARTGALSVPAAIAIARQIALALAAAHASGIVHRDLKPDNVFLVADPAGPRVKLLDFGIAKLAPSATGVLTVPGLVLGTPQYMSPEQARPQATLDGRSDLYALGCILFQLVCGRVPFDGMSPGEVLWAHLHAPVPRAGAHVPAALDGLIGRLLAKRPADRPASALEVATALDAIGAAVGIARGEPVRDRPLGPAVAPAPRPPRPGARLILPAAIALAAAAAVWLGRGVSPSVRAAALAPSRAVAGAPPRTLRELLATRAPRPADPAATGP